MANSWYLSSATYAAATAFVGTHSYSIGDFLKPTAPTTNNKWIFRCTTAGVSTTEPSWSSASGNNTTISSGTATFTNVTGQSAYGWSAAAGDIGTISGVGAGSTRIAGGDTCYVSSDHSESQAGINLLSGIASSAAVVVMVSVNRAGSVPPVAADITFGALFTASSGQMKIDNLAPVYWNNCAFVCAGTGIYTAYDGLRGVYLANCTISITGGNATAVIASDNPNGGLILDNTTVKFSAASQGIGISPYPFNLTWINTPSAVDAGGTIPTYLFLAGPNTTAINITCRGVDLSAVTTSLVKTGLGGGFYLFDSCKIASGVTRFNNTIGSTDATGEIVELVNCFDGNNIIAERHTVAGDLTTERTIVLSGGAQDDVGLFSHKIVTTAVIDDFVNTMAGFWMDIEQSTVGVSKTANVQIISSSTLTNQDISLKLQYEGTANTSVASFASNFIATPLTSNANVSLSTVTWNSSPATPVKQVLSVPFTPQTAGRLRGVVQIGKPSTTVYYNPQITVT